MTAPDGPPHAGLAFFGTVTASVTHELNNILSILSQVNGLLRDHIAVAETGKPVPVEVLRRVEEKIERQTTRGIGVLKSLNRFAHTVDDSRREIDLAAAVTDLLELSRRLADQRRVELRLEAPAEPVRAAGDPFALQQACFLALRAAWEAAGSGGIVTVRVRRAEGGPAISILAPRAPAPEAVAGLRAAIASPLAAWGGRLEGQAADGGLDLVLHLRA